MRWQDTGEEGGEVRLALACNPSELGVSNGTTCASKQKNIAGRAKMFKFSAKLRRIAKMKKKR